MNVRPDIFISTLMVERNWLRKGHVNIQTL